MSAPALLAFLGAPVALANGNGSLGQTYNQSLAGGGIVSHGVGLRSAIGTPGSSIAIAGIPSGASVVQAYLYVVQIVSSTGSYDTGFTLAGNSVTGALIGTSGDTCWGYGGNVTIRADVTSIVTGNGTYSLSGVGNGSSQLGQGASLVVVYRDSSSTNTTRVVINDGAISGNATSQVLSTSLSGFTVPSGVTSGRFHLAMGDSQSYGSSAVTLDGTTVLAANSFVAHDGAGWDDYTSNVSASVFVPGDTALNASMTITGDCLVWPYAAVSYTSCTAQTWYRDGDGDGFGGSTSTSSCTAPSGYVSTGGDCDDTRSTVRPGATEFCNTRDDDCDGTIDEDSAADALTWYRDADSDSYGNPLVTDIECNRPSGYVANATDCDDTRALTNPGASETCNGIDDDCDTTIDEDTAVDAVTWYRDADGDSFGSPSVTDRECNRPTGYVSDNTDCDDARALTYPGAAEYCNGIDDDCDTTIDEDSAVDAVIWYRDADGDSYGDPGAANAECNRPSGHVGDATDCDDTDAAEFPGAPEYCDGDDDDCDTAIDEDDAVDVRTWYRDADGDRFGDASSSDIDCAQPTGFLADNTDCDDLNATVYPGAAETPYDGIDQDCLLGDWIDVDGDGYSADVVGGLDCHDRDAAVYPGSAEGVDGVDEDCDGLVDDGTSAFDDDGDGLSEDGGDCDDADAAVSPLGVETVDGIDEDCDGLIDEDTEASDDDGDGRSEWEGDCDDADPGVGPGTTEIFGNGIDDDCDGVVDAGDTDADGDGVAPSGGDCNDSDASTRPGASELPDGVDNDCDGLTDEGTSLSDDDGDGFTEDGGDCDDGDEAVNPEAVEEVNGVDDDCDGLVDDGTDVSDDDGDGFSEEGGDCDDANPEVHPGAEELNDGIDNDCDGSDSDASDDADGDGITAADGDCDDGNGWVSPDTVEMCDGVDNNCNGEVDEDCEDVADAGGLSKRPGGACASVPGGGAPIALPALGLGLALVLRRRRR